MLRIEKIKRVLQAMAFAGVLAGLSFVMSQCGDDNGEDTEPETLAGIYTFTSATLGTELDIGGGQTLPAGTDLTEDFVGAILESSPCTNPEQTAIDLRKSGTTREIYYTCLDNSGTETQQGTWTEASDLSELTLFLTIQGTPFSLKVEDVTTTASALNGTIKLPGVVFGIIFGIPVSAPTVDIDVVFTDAG